jgi:CRP-like cAMP-binding protein
MLLVARPHLRGPLSLALVLAGAPLLVIAVAGAPAPAFAAVVVWGFGMAFADVILTALQFRVVDAPVLSRTTGAIESVKIGAEGLGALLAPALVALLGLRGAIALAGVGPILTVLVRQGALARVDRRAAARVARVRLLRGVPLFGALGVEALERLGAGARPALFAPGEDVVREGDRDARDFYVIEDGRAEVRLADWPVAVLGPGEAFGERALLRDAPRAATVRAVSELLVQAIDRETFLAAITGTASEARLGRPRDADGAALVETLRSLPMLAGLGDGALNELVAAGDLRSIGSGDAIVREGEPGDELFVLLRGSARVERDGRTVVELLPGDHFGEIALIHDVPRSATVRAGSDALLIAVGREAYRRAAGGAEAAPA